VNFFYIMAEILHHMFSSSFGYSELLLYLISQACVCFEKLLGVSVGDRDKDRYINKVRDRHSLERFHCNLKL